jgi:HSP20 family molecular chaperone IbpA
MSLAKPQFSVDDSLGLETAFRRQRQECFAPWRPPIEAYETATELTVRAEIGGVAEDEIEVLVQDDELVIRGERNIARSTNHRLYHESRVQYGPFEASVRLPFPVNAELAAANYRDGFLTVALPRLTPVKVSLRVTGVENDAQRGGQ